MNTMQKESEILCLIKTNVHMKRIDWLYCVCFYLTTNDLSGSQGI